MSHSFLPALTYLQHRPPPHPFHTHINPGEGWRHTASRGLERKAKSWSFLLASLPGLAFSKADRQLPCPEDNQSQKVNKVLKYFPEDQSSQWLGRKWREIDSITLFINARDCLASGRCCLRQDMNFVMSNHCSFLGARDSATRYFVSSPE